MTERSRIIKDAELEAMLERAAEDGARKALAAVGLHDDLASGDIEELRELLSAWRTTRREAGKTIVRWLTIGLLTAITFGVYTKLKGG